MPSNAHVTIYFACSPKETNDARPPAPPIRHAAPQPPPSSQMTITTALNVGVGDRVAANRAQPQSSLQSFQSLALTPISDGCLWSYYSYALRDGSQCVDCTICDFALAVMLLPNSMVNGGGRGVGGDLAQK